MMQKFSKIRILVVDDHYIMRKTMKDMLKVLGYENMILAESGNEAAKILGEQLAKKEPVHLIVTDWMMADGTGIELVYTVKNSLEFYNIPVIMVTGEALKNNIARALEYGADSYLLKPFQLAELDQNIDLLLNRYAYPDEAMKNYFNARKLFLTAQYRQALPFLIKIFQITPTPNFAYKIFVCLENIDEKDKAERLMLEHKNADFLPILRSLKKLAIEKPQLFSGQEKISLIQKKISSEWSNDEVVDDIIMLANLFINESKDMPSAYKTLLDGRSQFKSNELILAKIAELEKMFPFLKDSDSAGSKQLINKGIRYINDLRFNMRKLKAKGKLSGYIKEIEDKLVYFPNMNDWKFELGIACIENEDVERGTQLVRSSAEESPDTFIISEIEEYLEKYGN